MRGEGLTILPYPMVTRLVTLSQKHPSPRCMWLKSPSRSSEVTSCTTCMPCLHQEATSSVHSLADTGFPLYLPENQCSSRSAGFGIPRLREPHAASQTAREAVSGGSATSLPCLLSCSFDRHAQCLLLKERGKFETHHNNPEHDGKDGADSHVERNHHKDQGRPFLH